MTDPNDQALERPDKAEPDDKGGEGKEKEEPEGTQEVKGEKMVPLAALHEERDKRKTLSKEVADLKKKAERLEQVEGHLKIIQPHLDLIEKHPDLVEKLSKQSREDTEQPDDEEAKELAQDLGLFTEAGELDVVRAQKLQKALDKRAEKIADRRINPLRAESYSERAALARSRAKEVKDEGGRQVVDDKYITTVFEGFPAEVLAQKGVPDILFLTALGMQEWERIKGGGGGGRDRGEPTLTESPGGRRSGAAPMSKLEEAAAKARGIPADKWRSLASEKSDVLE